MSKRRIRKLIDIEEGDFVALHALAARRGQSLKVTIEQYLHQLAEVMMHEEIKMRMEQYENSTHDERSTTLSTPMS